MRRLFLFMIVLTMLCIPFVSCATVTTATKAADSVIEKCGSLPVLEEPTCVLPANATKEQVEQNESCTNSVTIARASYLVKLHDYFVCVQSAFATGQDTITMDKTIGLTLPEPPSQCVVEEPTKTQAQFVYNYNSENCMYDSYTVFEVG